MWDTILWIVAVVLAVIGIARIVKGEILWGAVIIVLALLIGPGGVSLLT
ncbi:MAG TPA: GPGG-motif small membrane protein [Aeromicrobium sp.]|nr:GPGG-motif small membrane protein [Aeromicrobium sp.]